jgi:hypothetical protein
MSPNAHRPSVVVMLCVLGLALGAAGCSMDDVQFNGGVFDAVGLSDSAKAKSKSGDPELAQRAPLVVPPKLDKLPEPGDGEPPPDAKIAGIHDPDVAKQVSKKELQRQQAEYCAKNYSPNDASTDSAEGPLGPCRKSILTAIKKWNSEE